MYGESNPTQEEFDSAMQTLRDLGVATVLIEFSGGNDEGGSEGIECRDAEDAPVDVPTSSAYEDRFYRDGRMHNEGWVVYDRSMGETYSEQKRPATADEVKWAQVAKVLEHPIYDRWGSFAGEFYVHGTLTWDVAKGTHRLSGQESVEHYESFEYGDDDEAL